MKESTINDFVRDFLSIMAGLMTAIAVAFVLSPIVRSITESHFTLYLFSRKSAEWNDNLLLKVTIFGWLLVSSVIGSIVYTLVTSNQDIIHVFISSLVSLAIIFIVSGGGVIKPNNLLSSILILFSIPIGNGIGAWIGWKIRKE